MSENNGSAWPNNYPQPPQNNYGQQPSNAFGSQPGGYSAWSNNGQQAPYGPYGQPGTGGPSGPFGPSGPYGPGGPSAFSPQKKVPWVAVIIGFIAVACIVVGILFATGVIGSDDEKPVADPSPTEIITAIPTADPLPTLGPVPTIGPIPTLDPSPTNSNGQNADGSVNVGQWKVEFLEFKRDASDDVAKANQDVTAPESGRQWAAAKVRLTNTGSQAAPPSDVGITLNTDSGEEIWEEFGFHNPESVRGIDSTEPGKSVEAWFYMDIPSDMTSASVSFFDYNDPGNVDTDITVK